MKKTGKKLILLICAVLLTLSLGYTAAEEPAEDSLGVVGSIVVFGRYEQDGNEENGPEEIEWIVLDVKGGKSLLLSRYALDVQPYHTKSKKITWKDCSLRKWLNGEFLKAAFSKEERSLILKTKVDNSRKQGYQKWKKTKGGKDTKDKIFLLSYMEANKYFGTSFRGENSEEAMAPLTEYAMRKGADFPMLRWQEGDPAYGSWWLRSPGYVQVDAAVINSTGNVVDYNINSGETCVRPAMWVKPGKSISL